MNKKSYVIFCICAMLALFALAGCYQSVAYPELVTSSSAPATLPRSMPPPSTPTTLLRSMPPPSTSATLLRSIPPPSTLQSPSFLKPTTFFVPGQYRIVGTSVQRLPILSFVLGEGSDVTFILAAIHGNEPAGVSLVRRLGKYLQQRKHLMEGRRVVLLAVANPDGMAHRSRFNANGVDLNRNFPAANRVNDRQSGATALSEPEARVVKQLIDQYSPDRIVSIHQPLACIDYDGPGENLAIRMLIYCGLPVKKLGARPGSLGSYIGVDLGIPIITLEMRQNDSTLDSNTLWKRYGRALVAAIVYPERVQ